MPAALLETPVLDRLWAALDALLEAAELTADGGELELSVDTAVREVARAIVAAKEAALLEQRASDGGAGAPASGPREEPPGSTGGGFSLRRS